MPFTAAHPAIVLPFLKWRKLSATGLICGAVVPDFENFLRLHTGEEFSHSLPGLLLADLPGAVLLAFLFHLVLKQPVFANLPSVLRKRMHGMLELDFKSYWSANQGKFLVSAFAGSASHLAWDTLTHNSWLVQQIPIYQSFSLPLYGVNYPLFHVLQQVSTVLGMLLVLVYILIQPPKEKVSSLKPKPWYWPVTMTVAVIVFYFRFKWSSAEFELGNMVVTMVSGMLIGLLITSLLFYRSTLTRKN